MTYIYEPIDEAGGTQAIDTMDLQVVPMLWPTDSPSQKANFLGVPSLTI